MNYQNPYPATPASPPSTVGRSIMFWGAGAGGVVAFISLMGQSGLGVIAGLLVVVGALVGGSTFERREDETRHQRAVDLLMHDPMVLMTRINADRDLDLERLRGMIKKQHIELTEPRAMRQDLIRLSQSLTSLQLAAWEKSEKDPSFRAIFEQVSGMVGTTQSAVDGLLAQLTSSATLSDEDRQLEFERVHALYLELLDKWISRL